MTNKYKEVDLSNVDLLALINQDTRLKKTASTYGGEYSGPCPFCGGTDRFNVWPDHPAGKGRWWCRQCDRKGDALDYIQQLQGLSFSESCGRLALDLVGVGKPSLESPEMTRPQEPAAEKPAYRKLKPPIWDGEAALRALEHCYEALWKNEAAWVLDRLHHRGLRNDTIRRFRLGYNSLDQELSGLWVPEGIVIPCFLKDGLWSMKIRRLESEKPVDRYRQVKGSGQFALFGTRLLEGKSVAVICEGEFDAMLLHQEAGDLVDVVAKGSAMEKPALLGLACLARAATWLIALDADDAGEKGAAWWDEFSARSRRVRPPRGNDLTEFHTAGGDLRAWVSGLLAEPSTDTQPAHVSTGPVDDLERVNDEAESLEEQADHLLENCDGSREWAEAWARLAQKAGWPCFGMSWPRWAEEVAASGPNRARSQSDHTSVAPRTTVLH